MASNTKNALRRAVATLTGAGLTGLSGWYVWEHLHDVSAPIASASASRWRSSPQCRAPCLAITAKGERCRCIAPGRPRRSDGALTRQVALVLYRVAGATT